MNKDIRITFRVTPEDYERIKTKADQAHMSVSAYVRAAALRHKVVVVEGLKEQTHELAVKFAAKAWPDSEVLVTTHIDKPHIHSHFLVNAVCHQSGRMLRQEKGTLQWLRTLSDELCEAYGFSVLKDTQKRSNGMGAREYCSAARGESWKIQIICAIDDCMKCSGSKEEFIGNMNKLGYQVRWEDARRSITYTHPNGMKARDIKLFDKKYLKEAMEHEFRIRAEIIYGGAEAAPSADTNTAGADNYDAPGTGAAPFSRSASHERGMEGDDGVHLHTDSPYRETDCICHFRSGTGRRWSQL